VLSFSSAGGQHVTATFTNNEWHDVKILDR
jgi:hypothetical protein